MEAMITRTTFTICKIASKTNPMRIRQRIAEIIE